MAIGSRPSAVAPRISTPGEDHRPAVVVGRAPRGVRHHRRDQGELRHALRRLDGVRRRALRITAPQRRPAAVAVRRHFRVVGRTRRTRHVNHSSASSQVGPWQESTPRRARCCGHGVRSGPHSGGPEGEDYLSPCPDGSLTSGRPAPDHRVAMMRTRPASPLVRPHPSRWRCSGLVVTGCQTPIEGTEDDRAGHARGLRHLGPQPPGRRRGGGPHRGAPRRRRAAARRTPTPAGSAGRTTSPASSPSCPAAPGRAARRRSSTSTGRPCSASTPPRCGSGTPTPRPSRTSRPRGRPRRWARCPSSTPRSSSPAAAARRAATTSGSPASWAGSSRG